VIAILSGKGGVGKSTITVMLARALAKQGLRVGIMDADITGPSIPRLMNAHERYAYATKENEIIPVEVDGIKIMSLNYLVQNESDPVIWRGPILGNVVKQFYTDVVWGELDVLLIDMPPGTGDVALTILQSLPVQGVLMISTPQPIQ
jgi:Mrp family chromosome partitioning ATPase